MPSAAASGRVPAPAFLADEMLGRLTRTLRLLGFDVAYAKDATDDDILVRLGGRVLLTRDVELASRAARGGKRAVLVREIEHVAQAREVLGDLGLDVEPALVMTRCAVCNRILRAATAEEAERAPPGARAPFWTCDGCGRLYWEGSHGPRIRALAESFGRRAPPTRAADVRAWLDET